VYTPLAHAQSELTLSGWIPYWRDTQGIKDATKHLEHIDTLYPFSYTVLRDGSIKDNANMEAKEWRTLRKKSRAEGVEVIPTIMTSDGVLIHNILAYDDSRKKHIDAIVSLVTDGAYDGVDIDYEGKLALTRDAFSLFLTELKQALGKKKILSCTIEARTPPESLYREVPSTINYVHDYAVIGRVCDRIVIMAYDQQRADIQANDARKGQPYIPVADPLWVEKVVRLALQYFDNDKVVLGVPTYGRHWAVTVAPEWFKGYTSLEALNIPHILDLAKREKVKPSRNSAGEMSFSYLPKTLGKDTLKEIQKMSVPKGTPEGEKAALKALRYATETGKEVTVNVVWYSDAGAFEDKVKLAEKYGLRGVSLFKIDGEEDSRIWKYIESTVR